MVRSLHKNGLALLPAQCYNPQEVHGGNVKQGVAILLIFSLKHTAFLVNAPTYKCKVIGNYYMNLSLSLTKSSLSGAL